MQPSTLRFETQCFDTHIYLRGDLKLSHDKKTKKRKKEAKTFSRHWYSHIYPKSKDYCTKEATYMLIISFLTKAVNMNGDIRQMKHQFGSCFKEHQKAALLSKEKEKLSFAKPTMQLSKTILKLSSSTAWVPSTRLCRSLKGTLTLLMLLWTTMAAL